MVTNVWHIHKYAWCWVTHLLLSSFMITVNDTYLVICECCYSAVMSTLKASSMPCSTTSSHLVHTRSVEQFNSLELFLILFTGYVHWYQTVSLYVTGLVHSLTHYSLSLDRTHTGHWCKGTWALWTQVPHNSALGTRLINLCSGTLTTVPWVRGSSSCARSGFSRMWKKFFDVINGSTFSLLCGKSPSYWFDVRLST